MPFANYTNFKECVRKNQNKDDPEAYCAEIKQKVEGKSLEFYTNELRWQEVETKSGKEFFVEGYISTDDPDLFNDIVTQKGLDHLFNQLDSRPITMDLEHDTWRDEKTGEMRKESLKQIPVAKVVSKERRSHGIWVKAQLNKNLKQFKNIWKNIQDGFLNGFSIAFNAVNPNFKNINGVKHRLLDTLNLLNIGITGSAVNTNATFIPSLKSYIKSNLEDKTMTDEQTKTSDEASAENKSSESSDNKSENKSEDKSENKSENKSEDKSKDKSEDKSTEKKAEESNNESKPDVKALEATIVDLKKENIEMKAELKSINEALSKPQFKALLEAPITEKAEPTLTPLDAIGGI